jgi:hypothetical protein
MINAQGRGFDQMPMRTIRPIALKMAAPTPAARFRAFMARATGK